MEQFPAHNTTEEVNALVISAFEELYAAMSRKVDAIYDALGARVVESLPDADGQPKFQLYAPPEQSAGQQAWLNRPA